MGAEWKGNLAHVLHNEQQIGELPFGFTNREFCVPRKKVSLVNDHFVIRNAGGKSKVIILSNNLIIFLLTQLRFQFKICITSLTVNGKILQVGRLNREQFWISRNNECLENGYSSSKEIIIKNGEIVKSACSESSVFIFERSQNLFSA